jgi:two-component system chemotaxis response regulator CheY
VILSTFRSGFYPGKSKSIWTIIVTRRSSILTFHSKKSVRHWKIEKLYPVHLPEKTPGIFAFLHKAYVRGTRTRSMSPGTFGKLNWDTFFPLPENTCVIYGACRMPDDISGVYEMVTILVIDDSAFQRKILSNTLNGLNYQVITADNGEEGIEKALENKPDVIITDLLMPEFDGFWVLAQIKARKIKIPVIVVTSDVQTSTRNDCQKKGAVAFLNKPAKKEELQSAISSALSGGIHESSR